MIDQPASSGARPGDGRHGAVAIWAAAVAACAVCCAGPLLAVLAAVGVTAGVAAVAFPALSVLAVAALGGVWWLRRCSRARCAASAAGVQDLGLPSYGPREAQVTGPGRPAR